MIEPLSPRTLLAVTELTVRLYHDADHDGVRDVGEGGVSAITVKLDHRDAQGRPATTTKTTDSRGEARFTVYTSSSFPHVNVALSEQGRKYRLQETQGSAYPINADRPVLDLWARREGILTGLVKYRFTAADGSQQLSPLMGARAYVDFDRDGVRDTGEPRVTTDETGTYRIRARYGRHPVRIESRAGWRRAAGKIDAAMVSHIPRAFDAVSRVPSLHTQMFRPVVIDVLAVASGATNDIRATFDRANHVFANSDAGVFLRLVDTQHASLSASGGGNSLQNMLRRLSNGRDGMADEIPQRRNAVGADLVVAFAHNPTPNAERALVGLAYAFDDRTRSSELAYGVVAPRPGFNVDETAGQTLAHEIGHLLGAGHDVDAADDDQPGGASGASGAPPYAHGYRPNHASYAGDVMSYDVDTVVPAFSNPRMNWRGLPFGDADSADNVRRIRETAPVVSAYRRAPAPPPPPRVQGLVASRSSALPFSNGLRDASDEQLASLPPTL